MYIVFSIKKELQKKTFGLTYAYENYTYEKWNNRLCVYSKSIFTLCSLAVVLKCKVTTKPDCKKV